MPSMSYEKQSKENNRDIVLKKSSNEIILGKTTESTAMELDDEGGASIEQIQELIKKECDKRDKNYRSLERKYNTLQESLEQSQQKNSKTRGQGGTSNKKKLSRRNQSQRRRSTSKRRTQPQGSRQPNQQKRKTQETTNIVSNEHGRNSMRRRRSRSQPKKSLPPPVGTSRDYSLEQNNTTIWICR